MELYGGPQVTELNGLFLLPRSIATTVRVSSTPSPAISGALRRRAHRVAREPERLHRIASCTLVACGDDSFWSGLPWLWLVAQS